MVLDPCHTALCARPVSSGSGPLAAFARLRRQPYAWLLDSALPSERLGLFSFAGADPYLILRARGRRVEVECRRGARPGLPVGRRVFRADPLEVLRALLPPPPARGSASVPFAGGAVGYLGYELAQHIEALAPGGLDALGLPDLVVLFVDRVLALDHRRDRVLACGLGFDRDERVAEGRAAEAARALARSLEGAERAPLREPPPRGALRPRAPFAFFDQSTYAKAVDAVLEEIAAGNVYQACLTHCLERDFTGDAWQLYRHLRRINPAPFACYLELPEVTIVGSSPERFLQLTPAGRVESRPIKGTRPRGRFPDEDARLGGELARSQKDRAENLMIVDLVRNDLGRVCETGSVEVPELMVVEPYASVFQMVSTIRGRLRRDRDVVDLLRAAFPPGSMTGAPKIAAMRLLERLEPVRRGVYSGALGYLDVRGGADLCVVIRTLLLQAGRAYVHTGGGIVADSDPVAEYRETLDKARPLLAALEAAAGGRG